MNTPHPFRYISISLQRYMLRASLIAISVMPVLPANAIDINFDYRFDTQGMFSDPTRRAALEAAATVYDRFTDNLLAINPDAQNTWSLSINRPDGGGNVTLNNLNVNAQSITVFVGGWGFHPSVLGWAGAGNITNVSGSIAWQQTIQARGQLGALDPNPTDYGVWGGAITFNKNVDWHFDLNTDPAENQQDFLTTAMHEIGHILGFGEAASWGQHIQGDAENGYTFHGQNSLDLIGHPIALDRYGSHWAEGTYSVIDGNLQETAMDPSTPRGQRQWMTDLDYAGFADIGWEIPEPTVAFVFMSCSLLLLGRHRSTNTNSTIETGDLS
ncbi:PEP-CTERM sorting domain-containing protein [Poriferisphaera sp. WC338]|uniref:PEP-CTERM sorting domain-containing protein n=1 Tax=Poriferisphaera sp. WC338 TaxID=3425129 RepID=UPI003D818DE8